MKRFLPVLLFFVCTVSSVLYAGSGTTFASFMKLPLGNRAAAMGRSYTALSEGPASLYWNPAGLAKGVFNEGRLAYSRWIEGIYYGYAGYRHSVKYGGIGLSVLYLDSGSIPKRGNGREELGTDYSLNDISVDAGFGMKITEGLNAGIAVKYFGESADTETAYGFSGGLGIQYMKRYGQHYLNTGMSLMNLGQDSGYDEKFPLPAVLRIGIGDELMSGRIYGAAELDYYLNETEIVGGVGMELRATPFLDLRCGYRFGYEDIDIPYGLTAGFGLKYVENVEYIFDYSIGSLGDLGFINRLGMGIRF
ncbi:MAG: PorV/PorQ family protein [Elusimicrobiota bacterium]